MLCNHHHSLVPEPFHHLQKTPLTVKQSLPTLPSPNLWHTKPDEWVNKMWFSHTVEYYLAVKSNEVLIHATAG